MLNITDLLQNSILLFSSVEFHSPLPPRHFTAVLRVTQRGPLGAPSAHLVSSIITIGKWNILNFDFFFFFNIYIVNILSTQWIFFFIILKKKNYKQINLNEIYIIRKGKFISSVTKITISKICYNIKEIYENFLS